MMGNFESTISWFARHREDQIVNYVTVLHPGKEVAGLLHMMVFSLCFRFVDN